VVSTTLAKAEWNNSVLITGDLIEEVNKLKQQEGQDIAVPAAPRWRKRSCSMIW
jgi:hypothetical protein